MSDLRRITVLIAVVCLLVISPVIQANPGGNGDADRDMQCGGSCHGDPGLSATSSADIQLSIDRDNVYAGGTVAVTVTITGGELSNRQLIGIFLLRSLNNANDHPEESGWRIIQDPNGGSKNFVEMIRPSITQPLDATWTLQAPATEGLQTLYASIHHGATPNSEGLAFAGFNDSGLDISIGPVPDNLPQLDEDWEPPEKRDEGTATELEIETSNATSVKVEWRLEGDSNEISANVKSSGDGIWATTLPASISNANISYRIVMENEDFIEVTPWLQLITESPAFETNILALRLQMVSIMLMAITASISLQRHLVGRTKTDYSEPYNQTSLVNQQTEQGTDEVVMFEQVQQPVLQQQHRTWTDEELAAQGWTEQQITTYRNQQGGNL